MTAPTPGELAQANAAIVCIGRRQAQPESHYSRLRDIANGLEKLLNFSRSTAQECLPTQDLSSRVDQRGRIVDIVTLILRPLHAESQSRPEFLTEHRK